MKRQPRMKDMSPGFYKNVGVDGRSIRGKYFGRRWKELAPKLGGDPVKESILLYLLKHEAGFLTNGSVPTSHDLVLIVSTYKRLGLLDGSGVEEPDIESYIRENYNK